MFNEEQKLRFLREQNITDSRIKDFKSIFNKAEPVEKRLNADLCTFSSIDLQEFCEKCAGMRKSSRGSWLGNLYRYLNWAVSSGINGAQNNLDIIEIDESDRFRTRMVSNPTHLSLLLDKVFRPISNFSTDTIYRSVYWLAFSGVDIDRLQTLEVSALDFNDMVVRVENKENQLYTESILTLKSCANLDRLRVYHPSNPQKYTWKDRAHGNLLLRGVEGQDGIAFLMQNTSRKVHAANKEGRINCKFTYETVKLSGIFYRLYELEQAGFAPDFYWLAERMSEGRIFKVTPEHPLRSKITRIATAYRKDYESWKAAFKK